MSNSSCPAPFLEAALFPRNQGYIDGRLCSTILLAPDLLCCLPCPFQDYVLHPSSLRGLHWNDIMNVIGIPVGLFVLLSFIVLPEKVTHRNSLGIAISVAALLINFCFVFPLHNLRSVQCANEITPADQTSNPICGFQGALHVFAGHSLALLVVCRTIYLHCQICWNLHFTRNALATLNIIGWLIPAVLLGIAFGVSQITYNIADHCSVRVDWIVNLVIIPVIIEVSCGLFVQLATFVYCVNVYLRSLREPPPPTTKDSLGNSFAVSTFSFTATRYPYRKAMARVNKVFRMQWRIWVQCFALVFTGTVFSLVYYVLATKYVNFQKSLASSQQMDTKILTWVTCLIKNDGNPANCYDEAAAFIPNQALLVIAEFSLSTCWLWVSLIFLRVSFFQEWVKLIKRSVKKGPRGRDTLASSTSSRSNMVVHLHTPSKDLLKPLPFENLYEAQIRPFRRRSFDIRSPASSGSVDDHQASRAESVRPESHRTGSSRPGSLRSSTFTKKERVKKVGIADILAMRRMERRSEDENEGHPETAPTKVVVTPNHGEELWPTFQFGHNINDLNA